MPRPMQWITNTRGHTLLPSGSQTNLPLFTAISLPSSIIKGCTVTRMIVDLILSGNAVAQMNEMHWGILVVNGDAAAVGQFPEADDPSDRAGWLVRGRMFNIQDSLSDQSQWTRVQLDLRSQRILRNERDELHLILDTAATGFSALYAAYVRVLMKLP